MSQTHRHHDHRSHDTRNFDDVAERYDESLPPHVVEHYLRKRAAYVRKHCPPPARLLDVGCGTGALAERLAEQGYAVAGIDPSEGMLEVLRRRCPGVEALHGSATSMPFADEEFDLALTVATLHHIAKPADVRTALIEMVRVVKPGGLILVWDHNPRNPYWPYIMRRVPQDIGEERLVGVDEILSGLRAGGAEPEAVAELGLIPDFVPPRLLPATARLERLVERTPGVRRLCAHNVVLARRF